MAMPVTPARRAFPRELALATTLVLIALVAAILLGSARVLPAPSGLPYQLDQQTMEMQRAVP